MFGFLKKMFSGDDAPAKAYDPIDYNGYRIVPAPQKEAQGYRVRGRIEKEEAGETLVHEFVRADTYFSEEDTLAVIEQKGKRLVDEQGMRMFGEQS